jgi:hypothetical protein
MKPIDHLKFALREVVTDHAATPAQVEQLRQLARSVLDHDDSSADEIRAALRWSLDFDPPDVRSFATDAGLLPSRRP